jgi:hypothetical protein
MSESPARLHHVRQELQRFLSRQDDCLINDSLRRAIMQHDLWAVFDWTAQSAFRVWVRVRQRSTVPTVADSQRPNAEISASARRVHLIESRRLRVEKRAQATSAN